MIAAGVKIEACLLTCPVDQVFKFEFTLGDILAMAASFIALMYAIYYAKKQIEYSIYSSDYQILLNSISSFQEKWEEYHFSTDNAQKEWIASDILSNYESLCFSLNENRIHSPIEKELNLFVSRSLYCVFGDQYFLNIFKSTRTHPDTYFEIVKYCCRHVEDRYYDSLLPIL